MMKTLIFTVILIMSALQTSAQLDGNPENWCRNGAFPRESNNYVLATIKGKKAAKVYFYDDDNNCPNDKNCRKKSYLVPNDKVIVSRKFGNWACVWYQPKKGSETVGWIALKNLKFSGMPDLVGKEAWIGKWSFYDSTLEIVKTGEKNVYTVKGTAFWRGLGDNIHIGELDGEAKLTETRLEYGADDPDEYACKVTIHAVGRFLIVSDNLNCGGANVSFSGVYQRKK